jgi:hypothetical protein
MAIGPAFTKDELATEYGQRATHGTLYTTAPTSSTPGAEVTGGTPAFARKPLTWSAPSGGVITASAVFDIPAGTTVVGTGLHNALTGGTYIDGKTVSSVTFDEQDTVTANFSFTQV